MQPADGLDWVGRAGCCATHNRGTMEDCCENCGMEISEDESRLIFENRMVCAQCFDSLCEQSLLDPITTNPSPQPETIPLSPMNPMDSQPRPNAVPRASAPGGMHEKPVEFPASLISVKGPLATPYMPQSGWRTRISSVGGGTYSTVISKVVLILIVMIGLVISLQYVDIVGGSIAVVVALIALLCILVARQGLTIDISSSWIRVAVPAIVMIMSVTARMNWSQDSNEPDRSRPSYSPNMSSPPAPSPNTWSPQPMQGVYPNQQTDAQRRQSQIGQPGGYPQPSAPQPRPYTPPASPRPPSYSTPRGPSGPSPQPGGYRPTPHSSIMGSPLPVEVAALVQQWMADANDQDAAGRGMSPAMLAADPRRSENLVSMTIPQTRQQLIFMHEGLKG